MSCTVKISFNCYGVFIHANIGELCVWGKNMDLTEFPSYSFCTNLISEIICRVAVPLFYLISGYLFFFKTNDFNLDIYLDKLKSRGRSLFLPYIIWNTLYILLFFVAQSLLKLPMNSTLISDYTIRDWFYAYCGNPENMYYPIDFPLWFIRDLLIVMLFTPIIYFLIKRTSWLLIVVMGIIWLFFNIDYYFIVSYSAFFFFSIGALFGIEKKNFAILAIKSLPASVILYIITCALALYYLPYCFDCYIKKINIMLGLSFFIGLCAYFIKKRQWKTNNFIAGSSFFVFAYHAIPLSVFIKFILKELPYDSRGALIMYFGAPLITIIIGLLIYEVLNKYCTKLTHIITGGR